MLSSTSPVETLEVVAHHDDDDVRRECDGPPHRSDVEGRSGRPSSAKKSKEVLCIMERIAVSLVTIQRFLVERQQEMPCWVSRVSACNYAL